MNLVLLEGKNLVDVWKTERDSSTQEAEKKTSFL